MCPGLAAYFGMKCLFDLCASNLTLSAWSLILSLSLGELLLSVDRAESPAEVSGEDLGVARMDFFLVEKLPDWKW